MHIIIGVSNTCFVAAFPIVAAATLFHILYGKPPIRKDWYVGLIVFFVCCMVFSILCKVLGLDA